MAVESHTSLVAVGISTRSASAALSELLFDSEPDQAVLLAAVREFGMAEGMAVATCERVELWASSVATDPTDGFLNMLARKTGLDAAELRGQVYCHRDDEAVRHVFAVAASLDSQVVGEPQILGQVKECHRQAAAAGLIGPVIEPVLQAAYGAAKRVRGETPLAQQPVSIAASATLVARDVHGDLGRRTALLIGLGEMGEFLAAEFKDAGIGDLVVMHTSATRSEAVARRLNCHFRPWEELDEGLAGTDIVIAAMGTGRYAVTAPMAETALKQRRREAIFFIDAALPGDIDPAVGQLDAAFVFDLADLERVARQGKATREAATTAAWRILDEEIAAFQRRRAERGAGPSVVVLRRRFEALRAEVLEDSRLGADEATRLLLNRLLHDPSEVLRQAAVKANTDTDLDVAVRRLFRLDLDEEEDR
ncbi:MAG: glutamyl-tRNA reductase [Alphaproteobacteria bacterium]